MVKFTIRGTLPGLNELIEAERSHRQMGAKLKKQCEAVVLHAARSLGKWRADGPVRMVYRWYEPNRRRDKDNVCAFGRKVIQDALVRGNTCGTMGGKRSRGLRMCSRWMRNAHESKWRYTRRNRNDTGRSD